jgi:hydrogenase expression/formation protein HypD
MPQIVAGEVMEVSKGVECRIEKYPVGVVASITPFNFPNMVPNWTIPNALVLGNTMVLKPSELVPISANRIAALLKEAGSIENFSILSSHRITPPAMEYVILNSEIDAVLCPGHVAMVIGTQPFDRLCRKYKMPCVISGFEPVDVLQAILKVLYSLHEKEISIINQYSRVVGEQGNTLAQSLIDEVFTLKDSNWRGVGSLPESRLVLNSGYSRFDAEMKFGLKLPEKTGHTHESCMCGEILKGAKPQLCPSFGKGCTPDNPKGPCMVTREGTCCIAYTNKCD